jgi:chloramphenicol-sensitive protein RarD
MAETDDHRSGLMAAMTAYGMWGFLPLYFQFLGDLPPLVILAHRIIWSAPTAIVLALAAGKAAAFAHVFGQPRLLFTLFASSIAIAANWGIYIWAVTNHRVLEGSLGYYINPLIVFLFAAIFFGERFRPLQLLAVLIAGLGVANQTLVVGQFPWVSLSLAVSFAVYGAIRKTTAVDSRIGFGVESLLLAPAALIFLTFFLPPGVAAFGKGDPGLVSLLILAGPLTAAPLILFAIGARRLRLSTIGILQFIAPTVQLGIGIALGEAFTMAHALTFGLIWTGVVLFTLSGRSRQPDAGLKT